MYRFTRSANTKFAAGMPVAIMFFSEVTGNLNENYIVELLG